MRAPVAQDLIAFQLVLFHFDARIRDAAEWARCEGINLITISKFDDELFPIFRHTTMKRTPEVIRCYSTLAIANDATNSVQD